MSDTRNEWNQQLEPPVGGLERMRQRLAGDDGRPSLRTGARQRFGSTGWIAFASIAAAAAVFVIVGLGTGTGLGVGPGGREPPPEPVVLADAFAAPAFDRLLGRPTPEAPVTLQTDGQRVVARELPSANPRVRIVELP